MARLLMLAAAVCAMAAEPPQKQLERWMSEEVDFKPAHDRWPDWSAEAFRAAEARDRGRLVELRKLGRAALGFEQRADYDVLERELLRRLEQFRLRMQLTPWFEDARFAPGPLAFAASILGQRRLSTLAEAEQLVRKLKALPAYLQQVTTVLREGMESRILPSQSALDWQVREVASLVPAAAGSLRRGFRPMDAIEATKDVSRSVFYRPFRSMTEVSEADSVRIQTEARKVISESVIPAAIAFQAFLTREYVPACRDSVSVSAMPGGADVYRAIVRRESGSTLDPKQIYEMGQAEVLRIRKQIQLVAMKLGHKGSVDEFLASLNGDKQQYFSEPEELVAAYRAAIARVTPLLPKVVRRVPTVPLQVEAATHGGVAAMYRPPLEGRNAVVMVEVSKLNLRPKFEVLAIALHEGVPGHHLQLALSPRRGEREWWMLRRGAFAEGWALYAEGLGDELGLYANAYDKTGQLIMELIRAIRMVVDTGIHAQGWTMNQAKQYFRAHTGKPEAMAELEVGRAVWPGGSITYKLGEMRIRAMRARASEVLGRRFDLRGFHDALLRWAPLPMDVMERKLEECLKERACEATMQVQ